MNLLLDTHALLWWLADGPELPGSTRERIADTRNNVVVSAASTWEIVIKVRLGRLKLPLDAFHEQLATSHFTLLPITIEHTRAYAGLPRHHKDPFDRMLIAQALHEKLVFVTKDATVARYPVETLWA